MALHGWEETGEQLSALAQRGAWTDMPALISDEMLETFAVVSTPEALPQALHERYDGRVERLGLYLPFIPGQKDAFWEKLVQSFP